MTTLAPLIPLTGGTSIPAIGAGTWPLDDAEVDDDDSDGGLGIDITQSDGPDLEPGDDLDTGAVALPGRLQCARIGKIARRGLRRIAREEGDDAAWRAAADRRLPLRRAAIGGLVRPAGMRHQEPGIAVERQRIGLLKRAPLRDRRGDRAVARHRLRLRADIRKLRSVPVERFLSDP